MGGCSVLGCKSRTEKVNNDVTFHSFPKDTFIKNVWINATGRQNWQPNRSSKICSIHFDNDAISIVNKNRRIKPEAIPVKHVHVTLVSLVQPEAISVNPSISLAVASTSQKCIRDPNHQSSTNEFVTTHVLSIDVNDDVDLCVNDDIDVPDTHDYISTNSLSEFSIEVTKYIAGFIVSKMFKIIKCEECLASLISVEKYSGLISHKDVGGLRYPSKDVVKICIYTEKTWRSFLTEYSSSLLSNDKLLPKMVLVVVKKFVGEPLFSSLSEHVYEQSPFDNHLILLLKAIIYRYFEVRIHFLNKCLSNNKERVRNFHNKLVLFKGQ